MDTAFAAWLVRNVAAHETVLKKYLAARGLQSADTADLCHDVYVRILESVRKPPVCAKALALSIARNLAIDQHRSARNQRLQLIGDPHALDRPDELDPLRRAIAAETLETLCAAIEDLPARRKQVFIMRRMENRSLKEIACALGITVKAVEQSVTLALHALRARVDGPD
jgi:RNA polymerase sigma factor (sigma-70 family)